MSMSKRFRKRYPKLRQTDLEQFIKEELKTQKKELLKKVRKPITPYINQRDLLDKARELK